MPTRAAEPAPEKDPAMLRHRLLKLAVVYWVRGVSWDN